jgi:hypothetical protein
MGEFLNHKKTISDFIYFYLPLLHDKPSPLRYKNVEEKLDLIEEISERWQPKPYYEKHQHNKFFKINIQF